MTPPSKDDSSRDKRNPARSPHVLTPKPDRTFVQTEDVKKIINRSLNYLRSGFPVHFRGPTGVGKTTLALHVAHRLKQSVVLIHGDDHFTTADLTGGKHGFSHKKIVDEFVRGVSKTEESLREHWMDHKITVAVRHGYTLLYDEFTRSRPEANNILLSILQEGVLDFPVQRGDGESYLKVHPNFKAIFTSNPEEYAGVHTSQDALLDRMVTIDLDHYDFETEVQITAKKSNLSAEKARCIVQIVRGLRDASLTAPHLPTIRGCVMVARSVKREKDAVVARDSVAFRQICFDILIAEMARNESRGNREAISRLLSKLITRHCPFEKPQSFRLFRRSAVAQ
jgi:nitric oxide reductase NorQ protein